MKVTAITAISLLFVAQTGCQQGSPSDSASDSGAPGGKGDSAADADHDGGATADAGGEDAMGALAECPDTPGKAEPNPPVGSLAECSWMDWNLSADGFYVISQFGTTADPTTMGRNTSCGALQTHYAGNCCLYDIEQDDCLDLDKNGQKKQRKFIAPRGTGPDDCNPENIPETGPQFIIDETRTSDYWYTRRSIDWNYWTVLDDIRDHYEDDEGNLLPVDDIDDFPIPAYFYVAGAQRFGCDTYLRVSNPANGRCIVVYVDDGGPGSRYEQEAYAGRRILDSSPAVTEFLDVDGIGWKSGSTVYVEWGQPGDKPGDVCTPCQGLAAMSGTESHRSPFDLVQGFSQSCRDDALGGGTGVHDGTPVNLAP